MEHVRFITAYYIKTIEDSILIDNWKHNQISVDEIVSALTEKEIDSALDDDENILIIYRVEYSHISSDQRFAVQYDSNADVLDILLIERIAKQIANYELYNEDGKGATDFLESARQGTRIGRWLDWEQIDEHRYNCRLYEF